MILKNIVKVSAISFVFLSACISYAHATPTITSPYVHEGETAAEVKSSYDFDEEDSWEVETSLSHGFTPYWESELSVEGASEEDKDEEFTSLNWENKFQLAPAGKFFIDPGVKIEYSHSLNGEPDELQAKLLLAKKTGSFDHIANVNVSREIGEDSGNDLGYGLSYGLAYEVSEDFAIGAEWYSDFGDFAQDFDDQGHEVGPVAYGELPGGLEYETGALFGVTEGSPDATVKLVLEYPF